MGGRGCVCVDELLDTSNREPSSRLPSTVASIARVERNASLDGWKGIASLGVLSLHYDVTPAQFITMVVSEIGIISSTSVVSVLREMRGM